MAVNRNQESNFNQKLSKKGIRILPVRISGKRALIYVYRPEKLKQDFFDEFPHEIGLFLGYPAEDVKGFIENGKTAQMLNSLRFLYNHEFRRADGE